LKSFIDRDHLVDFDTIACTKSDQLEYSHDLLLHHNASDLQEFNHGILQIASDLYDDLMSESTQWLDDKEAAAWGPFVVATMNLHAQLERDLKEAFDITLLDHGILLMVRNASDGLSMGHLAAQFGTEASVITYRVSRLTSNGYVTRNRSQTDRRQVLVIITRRGAQLCDRMGPVHVASVRRHYLDHVPRRDLAALADAFSRLYAAQRAAELPDTPDSNN
jgi:DNA-binding MarR family transcriptional regulator